MKLRFATLFVFFAFSGFLLSVQAQVGIGTTNPDSNAILELRSTTKGFLPPRLTSQQRDSIMSLTEGLVIYNLDIGCLEMWDGVAWKSACYSSPCDPSTEGNILDVPDVCYNGNPDEILSEDAARFAIQGTITYVWQKSEGNLGIWVDVSPSNSESYNPPNGFLITTSFRRVASTATGCGPLSTSAVEVKVLNPLPSTITGPSIVCQSATGIIYSVDNITEAVSYTWGYTGTGVTFSGGSGTMGAYVTTTPYVTAAFSGSATSGNITLTVNYTGSGCSNQAATPLTIIVQPGSITSEPFEIDGPACVKIGVGTGVNQAYSLKCYNSNFTYTWTTTSGGSITGGSTGFATTINWSGSASNPQTITVTPRLATCPAGTPVTYNVVITAGTCVGASGSAYCTDADITLGTQTWMRCNMNVGTGTSIGTNLSSSQNPKLKQKACYNNDLAANGACDFYGGVYSWAEALQYNCGISHNGNSTVICGYYNCSSSLQRGICPNGYHIPTKSEWSTLKYWLEHYGNGGSGYSEGAKTKNSNPNSVPGSWGTNANYPIIWNGTNSSGLGILPGGYNISNIWKYKGSETRFWSSTEKSYSHAYIMKIYSSSSDFKIEYQPKTSGQYVRCLKNP